MMNVAQSRTVDTMKSLHAEMPVSRGFFATTIAAVSGLSPKVVSKALAALATSGVVGRVMGGRYYLETES